ncbi:hypothetical protein SSX86_031500 [Deinandra increscens subsp. villosa]|uniref:Uncharacterized protein n=1 Tax=Deinandra increscens subsp. villosa TaxID=3103831 RepID=A0AAP0GIN3_9ASTR
MNINHHSPQSKWSTGLFECGRNPTTCNHTLYIYVCMFSFTNEDDTNEMVNFPGLITCCFPCVTFGEIAEVLDEGKSSCVAHGFIYAALMTISCQWVYSFMFRERLRAKYGLPSDSCSDCCVHLCCEPFALCQEHAELKHRGLDPSKGWIEPPPYGPPRMPRSMERV